MASVQPSWSEALLFVLAAGIALVHGCRACKLSHLSLAGLQRSSVALLLLRQLGLCGGRTCCAAVPLCISVARVGPQPLQGGIQLCVLARQAITLLLGGPATQRLYVSRMSCCHGSVRACSALMWLSFSDKRASTLWPPWLAASSCCLSFSFLSCMHLTSHMTSTGSACKCPTQQASRAP